MERHDLPVESPDCRHVWEPSPTSLVWTCAGCGCQVAAKELHQYQEGDTGVYLATYAQMKARGIAVQPPVRFGVLNT